MKDHFDCFCSKARCFQQLRFRKSYSYWNNNASIDKKKVTWPVIPRRECHRRWPIIDVPTIVMNMLSALIVLICNDDLISGHIETLQGIRKGS